MDEEGLSDEELGIVDDEVDGNKLIQALAPSDLEQAPESMLAEFRKIWNIDEFIAYLHTKLKERPEYFDYYNLPEALKDPAASKELKELAILRFGEQQRNFYLYKNILEAFLDILEDTSMGALLGKTLKVGQKFSYEYDFGSTTRLKLKVAAEREGIVQNKRQPVHVLARNNPPVILCQVCGKTATQVTSGYYDAVENGYCSKCARQSADEEMLLPVVNSPRIGVCAYTG